jgi:hypothetical protein
MGAEASSEGNPDICLAKSPDCMSPCIPMMFIFLALGGVIGDPVVVVSLLGLMSAAQAGALSSASARLASVAASNLLGHPPAPAPAAAAAARAPPAWLHALTRSAAASANFNTTGFMHALGAVHTELSHEHDPAPTASTPISPTRHRRDAPAIPVLQPGSRSSSSAPS